MAPPQAAVKNTPSLAPREHGAYSQLVAPVVAALLAKPPSLAGLCFACAFVSAFYAHEPWLIILGQRGARTERAFAEPARRRLLALASVAALFGIVGLLMANPVARASAVGVGLLAILTALLGKLKQLHSAVGEVWAGVVFASLSIPISLSSNMSPSSAISIAIAWALSFGSGVFAVRAVIARKRTGKRGKGSWGIFAVLLLQALESRWAIGPALAVLPLTLASLVIIGIVPAPKHLRKIGWALVVLTAISAFLIVVTARVSWFQA